VATSGDVRDQPKVADDAPNKFRSVDFCGKHPAQKKQITRLLASPSGRCP
jgi:hypothetical protein